ncbi:transposase [Treponema sp. OMZ 840]|uniref:transposase n=1 Tax=Treponema sp. OMZ 840 TaxID=244313 RepID=UPI003D9435F3
MNKYSTEFKAQALQLSDEIGTRKASQDLGISYHTLSGWRKSQNRYKDNCTDTVGKSGMTETERQRTLEKENRELKETVRILQDALRFFVKGQNK